MSTGNEIGIPRMPPSAAAPLMDAPGDVKMCSGDCGRPSGGYGFNGCLCAACVREVEPECNPEVPIDTVIESRRKT